MGPLALRAAEVDWRSVISTAIVALLRELDTASEPSFKQMATTAWTTQDAVHGPSPYVAGMVASVEAVVEAARNSIEQKKWTRNFLDKAAKCVVAPTRSLILALTLGVTVL